MPTWIVFWSSKLWGYLHNRIQVTIDLVLNWNEAREVRGSGHAMQHVEFTTLPSKDKLFCQQAQPSAIVALIPGRNDLILPPPPAPHLRGKLKMLLATGNHYPQSIFKSAQDLEDSLLDKEFRAAAVIEDLLVCVNSYGRVAAVKGSCRFRIGYTPLRTRWSALLKRKFRIRTHYSLGTGRTSILIKKEASANTVTVSVEVAYKVGKLVQILTYPLNKKWWPFAATKITYTFDLAGYRALPPYPITFPYTITFQGTEIPTQQCQVGWQPLRCETYHMEREKGGYENPAVVLERRVANFLGATDCEIAPLHTISSWSSLSIYPRHLILLRRVLHILNWRDFADRVYRLPLIALEVTTSMRRAGSLLTDMSQSFVRSAMGPARIRAARIRAEQRTRSPFTNEILSFIKSGILPAHIRAERQGPERLPVSWVAENSLNVNPFRPENQGLIKVQGIELGSSPFWEDVRIHFEVTRLQPSITSAEAAETEVELPDGILFHVVILYFTFTSLVGFETNLENLAEYVRLQTNGLQSGSARES